MAYQGGKQKIGKHIYRICRNIEDKYSPNRKLDYFEPFVGFCGVMKHFADEDDRNCTACDINPDIINMWKALQNGWIPTGHCPLEKYNQLKLQTHSSPEKTLYGHICSYGGLFFNYYLKNRDYAAQGTRTIMKIGSKIKKVDFLDAKPYTEYNPNEQLVYCDPPYNNNKLSNTLFQKFDHDKFWKTMREWSKNNIVLISEREAPGDFVCVWELERRTFCTKQEQKQTEKLFIHQSILQRFA